MACCPGWGSITGAASMGLIHGNVLLMKGGLGGLKNFTVVVAKSDKNLISKGQYAPQVTVVEAYRPGGGIVTIGMHMELWQWWFIQNTIS